MFCLYRQAATLYKENSGVAKCSRLSIPRKDIVRRYSRHEGTIRLAKRAPNWAVN